MVVVTRSIQNNGRKMRVRATLWYEDEATLAAKRPRKSQKRMMTIQEQKRWMSSK